MKLASKISLKIIFPLLLIWQLLLTFQGLDLADTGFQLTAFRFIFNDPYSIQYSMMFWLSDVCGALWMLIWPAGGLYWFKLGWVMIISITFMLYLWLLSPKIGKRNATIGLAITLIFILQGGPECLNYDLFSALGSALGIIFLFQGLLKNRLVPILLSGLIFGMSVFFKLSNISALAFLLLILFSVILNRENITDLFKKTLSWIAGFGAGMIIILFLIWKVGHLNLFLDNLSVVSSMGKDIHSSHGLKPMLLSYMSGYLNAFILLIIFVAAVWVYIKYTNKYPKLFTRKSLSVLVVLMGMLSVLLTILLEDVFWSKIRYLFIGLMIVQGILVMTDQRRSSEIRLLSLAGLILLLLVPLGSDSGLGKSVWGMWILGPMVLTMSIESFQFGITLSSDQSLFLKRTFALVLLLSAMVHAWQRTYFDTGSRIKKIYAIEHPRMKCIYTSSERARVVNELILEAFPLMKNQEYLLSFIEIPMLNYLSDKKPFISTSWPKLYYRPQTFQLKLQEALLRRKAFPAIIRQKQNTVLDNWPGTPDPRYLNYPEGLSDWPEHGRILNEFIVQNNYQVVWENGMFQLLIHQ